jgi:ribosomal protein S14
MKAKMERDNKLRQSFNSKELFYVSDKALFQNRLLKKEIRNYLNIKQQMHYKLLVNTRYRIRNYCTLTGRSRSYIRFFRISRLKLRELALKGYLYGISKSSW